MRQWIPAVPRGDFVVVAMLLLHKPQLTVIDTQTKFHGHTVPGSVSVCVCVCVCVCVRVCVQAPGRQLILRTERGPTDEGTGGGIGGVLEARALLK